MPRDQDKRYVQYKLKSGRLVPEQGLRDSFGTPPPQVGITRPGV